MLLIELACFERFVDCSWIWISFMTISSDSVFKVMTSLEHGESCCCRNTEFAFIGLLMVSCYESAVILRMPHTVCGNETCSLQKEY